MSTYFCNSCELAVVVVLTSIAGPDSESHTLNEASNPTYVSEVSSAETGLFAENKLNWLLTKGEEAVVPGSETGAVPSSAGGLVTTEVGLLGGALGFTFTFLYHTIGSDWRAHAPSATSLSSSLLAHATEEQTPATRRRRIGRFIDGELGRCVLL